MRRPLLLRPYGAPLLALLLLGACQAQPPPPALVVSQPAPTLLGAYLTSTLPPAVPLQTALALSYGAAAPGFASLYTVASSGQVMRLFEHRAVWPGAPAQFPDRTEPVIRFGLPAGAEQFVLVVSSQPLRWLAPADYADQTPFARLNLDRISFESRLAAALAAQPPRTWQVQRLTLTTQ